jgi:uncharacterized membrane protein
MKKKFSFDPAWVILLMVVSALITLNFMEDEHAKNLFAGIVLVVCFVLFAGAVLRRTLTDRIG